MAGRGGSRPAESVLTDSTPSSGPEERLLLLVPPPLSQSLEPGGLCPGEHGASLADLEPLPALTTPRGVGRNSESPPLSPPRGE